MENKKAMQASLLPQYQSSRAFMERFLIAIHDENTEIERTPNQRGIKLIDQKEIDFDQLDYFRQRKTTMENEFLTDLSDEIGDSKANLFCEHISIEWYDGKTCRNGPKMQSIKKAIRDYLIRLIKISGLDIEESVIKHEISEEYSEFTAFDISKILTVNQRLIQKYLDEWKEIHPSSDLISNNYIYIRRGLCLTDELDVSAYYREWDYINSYSLAFSAPERFSQMTTGNIPALINGNIDFFNDRILFFSPFIKGMSVGQLEFGIIPSEKRVKIIRQGCFGQIIEYKIDYPQYMD